MTSKLDTYRGRPVRVTKAVATIRPEAGDPLTLVVVTVADAHAFNRAELGLR